MSHFKMIALHITLTRFAIYLRLIIVLIKDVATRYTRMMMMRLMMIIAIIMMMMDGDDSKSR